MLRLQTTPRDSCSDSQSDNREECLYKSRDKANIDTSLQIDLLFESDRIPKPINQHVHSNLSFSLDEVLQKSAAEHTSLSVDTYESPRE